MEYSAGVLPYTLVDGRLVFLIGRGHRKFFSDFGGRSDPADMNCPVTTAMREFYEETCGCVMSMDQLQRKFENPDNYVEIRSTTQSGKVYYMYLVPVAWSNQYLKTFERVTEFVRTERLSRKYREKDQLRWISLDNLRQSNHLRLLPEFQNTMNKVDWFAAVERYILHPPEQDGRHHRLRTSQPHDLPH